MDRQSLGRYTIVERIGAGGMGIVYKARDPRLKRDVRRAIDAFNRQDAAGYAATYTEDAVVIDPAYPERCIGCPAPWRLASASRRTSRGCSSRSSTALEPI